MGDSVLHQAVVSRWLGDRFVEMRFRRRCHVQVRRSDTLVDEPLRLARSRWKPEPLPDFDQAGRAGDDVRNQTPNTDLTWAMAVGRGSWSPARAFRADCAHVCGDGAGTWTASIVQPYAPTRPTISNQAGWSAVKAR